MTLEPLKAGRSGLAALALMGSLIAQAQPQQPLEDSLAQRSLACTHCHGEQGRAGPDGYYPRIAGKPATYLYRQLLNFRDGRRHYAPMTGLLDTLSDAYLMEIAQYFAGLKVPYAPPAPSAAPAALLERGEQLVRRGGPGGVQACTACHGQSLTGRQPDVPGLLGLPLDYLNAQLGAWRSGKRRAHAPDCMAEIARVLQPQDIQALASYLSAQALPPDPQPSPAVPGASACKPVVAAPKARR